MDKIFECPYCGTDEIYGMSVSAAIRQCTRCGNFYTIAKHTLRKDRTHRRIGDIAINVTIAFAWFAIAVDLVCAIFLVLIVTGAIP